MSLDRVLSNSIHSHFRSESGPGLLQLPGCAVEGKIANGTFDFDKAATEACKGAALLFLLWHHLFYTHPEYGFVIFQTAQLAKVCVAIFVLLSGYGLSKSVSAKGSGLLSFYVGRFAKLYLNYWLIAAIFVPVGVLLMSRPLSSAYNDYAGVKFLLQMLGLHRYLYPEYGYNATWWYMSVIVGLYLIFPLLHTILKRYGFWFLLLCFLLIVPGFPAQIPVLQMWIFPFALGVFLSQKNAFVVAGQWLARFRALRYVILGVGVLSTVLLRQCHWAFSDIRIDWLFAALIVLFTFEVVTSSRTLKRSLSFIGRHSFNIFLFHTFIYSYYWRDIVYGLKYPIAIFAFLVMSCLFVSMGIEALKRSMIRPGFHVG